MKNRRPPNSARLQNVAETWFGNRQRVGLIYGARPTKQAGLAAVKDHRQSLLVFLRNALENFSNCHVRISNFRIETPMRGPYPINEVRMRVCSGVRVMPPAFPTRSDTMSALPPKADMCGAARDVRFGPKADIICHPT